MSSQQLLAGCAVTGLDDTMRPMYRLDENDRISLPRDLVRFPLELRVPVGFRPEDPGTWPHADGRLEFVAGSLLFMPPSGDVQQDVCMDVAALLVNWSRVHPDFVVGGNEAGMLLRGDVRAADAAVWRRSDLGQHTGGFRRTAPVLAVEVAGRDEDESALRTKARWYLDAGVELVWLVLPASREIVVLARGSDTRVSGQQRLPESTLLPGLSPAVDEFFLQLRP